MNKYSRLLMIVILLLFVASGCSNNGGEEFVSEIVEETIEVNESGENAEILVEAADEIVPLEVNYYNEFEYGKFIDGFFFRTQGYELIYEAGDMEEQETLTNITFSQDMKYAALTIDGDNVYPKLWVINLETSEEWKIGGANGIPIAYNPVWGPDNTLAVFEGNITESYLAIYDFKAGLDRVQKYMDPGEYIAMKWSDDGIFIDCARTNFSVIGYLVQRYNAITGENIGKPYKVHGDLAEWLSSDTMTKSEAREEIPEQVEEEGEIFEFVEVAEGRFIGTDNQDVELHIKTDGESIDALYFLSDEIIINYQLNFDEYTGTYNSYGDEGELIIEVTPQADQILVSARDSWQVMELNNAVFELTDDKREVVALKSEEAAVEYVFYDVEAVTETFEKGQALYDQVYNNEENPLSIDELTFEQEELLDAFFQYDYVMPWETEGPGCSWYCGGWPEGITATSVLENSINYEAYNVHDFSLRSAWVEGDEGDGIGSSFTVTFRYRSPRVTEFTIYNGYQKSEETYFNNSRVKEMKVYIEGVEYGHIELQDTTAPQTFFMTPLTSLGDGIDITFEIVDIYKGEKYEDTCISEINFSGLDVHCLAEDTKIVMADGSEKLIQDIKTGDFVLGYHFDTKKFESIRVENIHVASHDNYVQYTLGEDKLIASESHPLVGSDMKVYSYAPAETQNTYNINDVYQIDETIKLMDYTMMTVSVTDIRSIDSELTGYAIHIDESYGYFANGILTMVY